MYYHIVAVMVEVTAIIRIRPSRRNQINDEVGVNDKINRNEKVLPIFTTVVVAIGVCTAAAVTTAPNNEY
jgi:hypothetical protein